MQIPVAAMSHTTYSRLFAFNSNRRNYNPLARDRVYAA